MIPKPLNSYTAIFFDVGDTLLTIPAAREIIQQFLADKSFYCDPDHIGELFDDAYRRFYYEKRNEQFEACTPETERAFWMNIYAFMLQRLGAEDHASEEELHRWTHEMYDLFTSPQNYSLFEDVKETVEALRRRGFRLGIISNFGPTLPDILADKGVLSYFDPVIVSAEVGIEKPNPAIFELALRKAGLSAGQVLYVGDHDQNDVWAPRQVGMDSVKIKRYAFHEGEGLHSLRELLKL